MVLELAETTLDVICVDGDVEVGVGDAQVVDAGVQAQFDEPKVARELGLGGVCGHHVDRDGLGCVLVFCIENEARLFPW